MVCKLWEGAESRSESLRLGMVVNSYVLEGRDSMVECEDRRESGCGKLQNQCEVNCRSRFWLD